MARILTGIVIFFFLIVGRSQLKEADVTDIPNKYLDIPYATLSKAQKGDLPDSGFIEIDGGKLQYVIEGEGIPCLVIGSSVYYPRTFSKNLRKHLKMYFVDMRWFAPEMAKMDSNSFTIKKIAQDIEFIRKYFRLEKPIIMGHSIHGSVAAEYSKLYSDKISALVMIGSPNIYGNETYDKITTKAWERASEERRELQKNNWIELSKIKDSYTDAELIVKNYCAMSPKYWYNPRYDGCWLWEGLTIHANLIHELYSRLFSNYYMFESKKYPLVPTIVFLGKYDYAIPSLLWENDKNIKNLTINILNKSAHSPQMEESSKFDEFLIDWLNKNYNNH